MRRQDWPNDHIIDAFTFVYWHLQMSSLLEVLFLASVHCQMEQSWTINYCPPFLQRGWVWESQWYFLHIVLVVFFIVPSVPSWWMEVSLGSVSLALFMLHLTIRCCQSWSNWLALSVPETYRKWCVFALCEHAEKLEAEEDNSLLQFANVVGWIGPESGHCKLQPPPWREHVMF